MPALATTVAQAQSDEWLQLEPGALEQAMLEDAGSLDVHTFDVRRESATGPALISNFALVDQVGALSSSALRAPEVARRPHSLAGGPGSGGKGPTSRRNQQTQRVN